ncbi:hypothetical protein [Nocardiopsis sp. ATB16-24]|uniref:hypothetical protein n=1 Tax=Nocardiopsis sp. ATB16-24 TaxID=3019555 RepID=UPI0025537FC0|nr:hypothetical protein [Nocardiopsis sp. ATB16-24]
MGHRHPSRLGNSDVGHARARRLLRAALVGCEECQYEGARDALADLAPGGVFDSLLTGFVLVRARQWHSSSGPVGHPATVYHIAPVDERDFWREPTRHCMRMCTVQGPQGAGVETGPALKELRLMPVEDRGLVLDDLMDGLAEMEG